MIEILGFGAFVAIWLSMLLQAFAIISGKDNLLKWGYICLLIGLIITFGLWALEGTIGELSRDVSAFNLMECVFILLFFASSLGSGYLCGLLRKRKEEVKSK